MAHRTRKVTRNAPKRRTKKKATKRRTKKKATKRRTKKTTKRRTKKTTKRNAKKTTKRRTKKKATKRRTKKKTTKRNVKKTRSRKKTSKKKTSKKRCKQVCISSAEVEKLRSLLRKLEPKKGDSKSTRAKKAKARARVKKRWADIKKAAACRLGQQSARARGQTPKKGKCGAPPRSVKASARALGYARAKKAKQSTPSSAQLTRAFLKD